MIPSSGVVLVISITEDSAKVMAAEIATPVIAAITGSPAPMKVRSISASTSAAIAKPIISPMPRSPSSENTKDCEYST